MNKRRKKNKQEMAILKPFQFVVILVLVILIGVILRGVYYRVQDEKSISKDVEVLRAEVDKFNQDNNNLNKLVSYFNSVDFQEKEIKEKLNLVKTGEKVVFIQGNITEEEGTNNKIDKGENKIVIKHQNYYYWWKYFFGVNNTNES